MAIKSRSDHLCKLTCVLMFSIYSCVIVWFITSETEIKSKYRIYSLAINSFISNKTPCTRYKKNSAYVPKA